jgi:hypothetical protein
MGELVAAFDALVRAPVLPKLSPDFLKTANLHWGAAKPR